MDIFSLRWETIIKILIKTPISICWLGAPKQENGYKNLDKLDVNVCIGVGGSLDVFAGKTKRAPYIFQKLGLEWLYRLIREPSRIGRMMLLPRFVLKVLFARHK